MIKKLFKKKFLDYGNECKPQIKRSWSLESICYLSDYLLAYELTTPEHADLWSHLHQGAVRALSDPRLSSVKAFDLIFKTTSASKLEINPYAL